MGLTIVLVAAMLLGIAMMVYNRIVALRKNCRNALADIDVHLRRRYEMVPNLVETVRNYYQHDTNVLEGVSQARARIGTATTVKDRIHAENALGAAVTNLFMVSEGYPQLRANEHYFTLRAEFADIENRIVATRRHYNNACKEFNTAIQQFPAVLVAQWNNYKAEILFEEPGNESTQTDPVAKITYQ